MRRPVFNDPGEEAYFRWLCSKVYYSELSDTHCRLMEALFDTEYYGIIGNDDNRGEDGKKLRDQFYETFLRDGSIVMDGPCRFLEMLVALAEDMEYLLLDSCDDLGVDAIFWEIVDNLGLTAYTDIRFDRVNGTAVVEETLRRVMDRDILPDGRGGMFPLREPTRDQRGIEFWAQAQDYLLENYRIF